MRFHTAIANMLRVLISFIILTLVFATKEGGPMLQAIEHITEMAKVADRNYDSQSRRILKSLRRDLARRRRHSVNTPSVTDDA